MSHHQVAIVFVEYYLGLQSRIFRENPNDSNWTWTVLFRFFYCDHKTVCNRYLHYRFLFVFVYFFNIVLIFHIVLSFCNVLFNFA